MYFLGILLFCVSILTFATACGNLNHIIFGRKYEFVDLTIPYDNTIIYFKTERSENETDIQSHPTLMLGGTHIEAPFAYDKKGVNVIEIPNEKLIVQLIVIDVSEHVRNNSKYVLRMSDVQPAIDNDVVKHMGMWPTLLVFKFGWCKYYHEEKYLGHDNETHEYIFPVISNEVAEWLITNETCQHVVGIGVDLPNIECNSTEGLPVHKTLAQAGLYIIENLNLTSTLPAHECTVAALPLKKKESARAPVNVVAICPNHEADSHKEIDKRDDHEAGHNSHHPKHKCKKQHTKEMHENHESHELHVTDNHKEKDEQEHHKTEETENKRSTTEASDQGSSTSSTTKSPKKEPETDTNNKGSNYGSINNNKEQNSTSSSIVKAPQKIIESVLKYKDIFKDQPQQ